MEETKEKTVKTDEERRKSIRFKKAIKAILKSRKIFVAAFVIVAVAILSLSLLLSHEKKVISTTVSSLKDVVETSKLSTVNFTYNSMATIVDEKERPLYHISYEGTVKAGFDFNELTAEMDRENKKCVIIIPEIEINSVNINDETIDLMFEKDKYDTETTFQEAYNFCYEDLESKAEENPTVKIMAYENAVEFMKAILIPLETELPNGYTFDFREGGKTE